METRLCNIFKTANAAALVNNIFESPYKVLHSSQKGSMFEQPVQFLKVV